MQLGSKGGQLRLAQGCSSAGAFPATSKYENAQIPMIAAHALDLAIAESGSNAEI